MGIRGQAAALLQLAAVVIELRLGQAAFEVGARVDAGRGVRLDADEIAAVVVGLVAEEVVEADLHHRGGRSVGADVAADAGAAVVGSQHHRHGIPAQDVLDAGLEVDVARIGRLLLQRDRVAVGGIECRALDDDVLVREVFLHGPEDRLRALRPLRVQQRLHGLEPLLQFDVMGDGFGAP